MKMTVRMTLDRETKGAVRYQEIDETGTPKATDVEGAVLGTLYVRKKAMGEIAKSITVTIETK